MNVKWKPIDVISLVIIASCLILIIMDHNGMIKFTLLAVVGLYYGIDLTPFIKLGRRTKHKEED
ncbi:hypothetical protein LCGC14_1281040 [marine sediment metagenome]|uniref:Uncharacterized protein n=1 Tax=marine sediment metagenome TaxID=412755 RepID=A0A0F9KWT5_9ZZZZ